MGRAGKRARGARDEGVGREADTVLVVGGVDDAALVARRGAEQAGAPVVAADDRTTREFGMDAANDRPFFGPPRLYSTVRDQ